MTNRAEHFRQHPDVGLGHDNMKLSSAQWLVNQFWMRRQLLHYA
jgi:hypothetical protein